MQKKNHAIVVTASAKYLAEQSDVAAEKFIWSYEITIKNQGDEIVQLLNRHWRIIDLTGKIEEVRAPGVVGLQPLIKPGKEFTYSSFCQLAAPQGTMEGYYEMQNLDEELFSVEIPKFILSAPATITRSYKSRLH